MKTITRAILVVSAAFLIGVPSVLADRVTPNPSQDYYYLFSLHFAGGTLTANKPAYEIMTGTRPTVAQGAYTLTIIDHTGKAAAAVSFSAGTSTVKVPVAYQTTGVRAVITKNGTTLLSIDTSLSSTCNQDGVCNAAVGEDQYQCPSDCFVQAMVTPPPMVSTPVPYSPVASQTPLASDSRVTASGIRLTILMVVGAVALIVLGVWRQHWMRPRA